MHLTLKQEATKPAAANALQQQARFDRFVHRDTPLIQQRLRVRRSTDPC
jgi:hypothetical protein